MFCGRVFTPDFVTEIENFSSEMLNLAEKFVEKPIVSKNVERAFREKATLKDKAIFSVSARKIFIAGIRHILNNRPLEKDESDQHEGFKKHWRHSGCGTRDYDWSKLRRRPG
ncbi:hypothetical protein QYM36_001184 [Artemia franciscana]|uniref:Uncharacterized protein n=1 Tax=Artemia franciscana TaxID=6661 RepID=A0AA88LAT3_ARTSF|nr:hypothetical protein QYM36_001184 [Artemia franciscana]